MGIKTASTLLWRKVEISGKRRRYGKFDAELILRRAPVGVDERNLGGAELLGANAQRAGDE